MRGSRLPAAALLGALALCLAQAAFYYGRLPWLAVSHFNAAGVPNGWMEKPLLIGIYVGTELLVAASFLFGGLVLERIPASLVNLPDREHWMAPERRAQTLDWLAAAFLWFGAATLVFMFDLFRQMMEVNLGAAAELSHPNASIGGYFAFSAVWTYAVWRRFRVR